MKKSLKILVLSFICLFAISSSCCLAINIDMNLSENTTSNMVYQNTSKTDATTGSNIADRLQALPESELGLTNILNILLIAVGVVLILLAIAIFIRLKK